MKPRVFLTRKLPPLAMQLLRENTELEMNREDRVLTKEEIINGIRGKDALLCLLTDTIDAEVMDENPDIKVISNFAVGFNNIDVAAATQRNMLVTNTPGVLTDTTADMAFALIMTVARRVVEGHKLVQSREWQGWGPLQLLGSDVSHSTLGLIGLGRIGQALVKRAKGFDMSILYWNRTRLDQETEDRLGVTYADMDVVLSKSDFVSINVAYNQQTHHLVSSQKLKLMKKSAYLINTARGPIVDEKALVAALKEKVIAGAGLDVYENEPLLEPDLYDLDNVVLAPHLGSATLGTRTKMGLIAVENLLSYFQGKKPLYVVNPEVLLNR